MFSKYIADKSFYKRLIFVVSPIVLQFFIQNFVNFLDNIMVGRLGENEIAAVAVANQYYKLFYPAVVSVCTAASIFTAQFFGSKMHHRIQKMFGIKVIFSIGISITFMIMGLIFTKSIIEFFLDDQEGAKFHAMRYLRISLFSYFPLAISTAFTFTFRPIGMTKVPMIASSIGMLFNLVLNFTLIYGLGPIPSLGVEGAAIATVISRFIELGVYLLFYFKQSFMFKAAIKEYLDIDFTLVRRMMSKMLPLFANEMAFSIALITIFKVYSERGVGAINVINIAEIVSQIVLILASGTGTATSIFVGQKLGSNELDEADKNANYLLGYSVMMGIVTFIIVGILAFIVPQFYNISNETRRLTTQALVIQGAIAPIMMLTRIPFFVLRSGGRVKEVFFLDSCFMWAVKVPVALLAGYVFEFDLIMIYLAVESTRILNAMISLFFFNQRKWLVNLAKEG